MLAHVSIDNCIKFLIFLAKHEEMRAGSRLSHSCIMFAKAMLIIKPLKLVPGSKHVMNDHISTCFPRV